MTVLAKSLLRALIVDDEPPALRRFQRLLEATGRVKTVAAVGSVESALSCVGAGDIDVAFLDIHMPREDGFSYVEQVPFDVAIVFVTAYSTFAARAFEVAAVDYLLKPVEPERLNRTLDRLEKTVHHGRETARAAETDLATHKDQLICLHLTGGARFVPEKDIVCILARDDYTQVMLNDGSAELVSVSMRKWEERLPPARFTRVHRSAIAAISLIERIHRQGGRWQAQMPGLIDPIPVNRAIARQLRTVNDL